ncbi:hypothetical protein ACLNGM_05610 [Aureimonas phyllosphaerae]|uniref:hypothetical protein n=1 Tax=Aureimonas phyllosphaerae TaxID=1166078 RepID=UPI0025F4E58B|nr:hypothetical protein [uncultured Aureimonas sp.]
MPMRDLAKLLADHSLQKRVRQSMQHAEPFKPSERLPDDLQRKLDELDRVFEAREKDTRKH